MKIKVQMAAKDSFYVGFDETRRDGSVKVAASTFRPK